MPFAFLSAALVALAGLPLRSAWAPVGSPAWHLPLAVALALAHWGGPRAAPGLAAGLALAYALAGLQPVPTLALALAGAVAGTLSWWLAARLAARCWLPALRDLAALLGPGLLAPLALHSLAVVAWLVASGQLPAADWPAAAAALTASALLAALVVTVPALVFASRPLARAGAFRPPGGWRALPAPALVRGLPRPRTHALAAAALFVGALIPCLFHSDATTWALHHLFLLAVPLRFGLPLAALAAAWSALLTLYLPTPLAGPLTTPTDLAAQASPLLLIALRCAGGLILGRAAGDARRAEADVRALNAGLEGRIASRTAELGLSEARYRALFEGTSVAIVLADAADGRCLDCNPAAVRLLGAPSRDQLVGPLPLQPSGEGPAALLRRMFALARDRGSSRFEWHGRTGDGADFHAEVFCTALRLDDRPLIQVVMNDITDRKRVEEALRHSEQRLALALEAANEGLWDWHIPRGEVFFSDGWYRMLGYQPGEVPMSVASWLDLMHPDDVPATRAALQAALDGSSPEYAAEFRLRSRSGEWRWVQTRGRVIQRDADGRPVRITGAHIDIDGFKRTQDDLRAAREAAEAAARAEKELVARMSHELRTPLNGVIGPLDLLAKTELSDPQRRYVTLARTSADLLLALIDDVLNVSRLEPQAAPFAPAAVTREAAAPPGLRGRHVLLVEDNRINAEVALAVLRGAGMHCTLATDGQAGVDAFARGDFDLVLMDCQLPVLDGIEAARRIRALPRGRRVPIVALTATATPETRQACADAGLDEYLSKPFNAPELLRALARLLGAAGPPPPEPPAPAAWSREAALARLGGREALLARVARQFLAGHAEALTHVRQALAAADAPALRAAAHRLKGQAATFDARPVTAAAARLEEAAARADLAAAPALADRLDAELARLVPELEAFTRAHPANRP